LDTTKNRSAVALLIAFAAIFVASGESAAQTDAKTGPEDSRWIPALALQTGFLVSQRKGRANSLERGLVDGESTAFFGMIGGSSELSTPRISFIPSQPRIFAHADVYYSIDNKESLASQGDPKDPINDPNTPLGNNAAIEGVLGVGTAIQTQSEPLILSGGVGLAFTTEAAGRVVRIKPSLEWMYQRDEIRLRFADVESTGPDPDGPCSPCRAMSTEAQTTKGFHSLGPGLEVDVDAGRIGDFTVSVFTQFRALRIMGDKKARLESTGSWFTRETERIDGENVIISIDPDPTREDSTVRSSYKRDEWGYSGAAGIRIYWDPK
jgi:hypothetical protein